MERLPASIYKLMLDGDQQRNARRRRVVSVRIQQGVGDGKGTYERGDKKFGYAGLCKALTKWRRNAVAGRFALPPAAADA